MQVFTAILLVFLFVGSQAFSSVCMDLCGYGQVDSSKHPCSATKQAKQKESDHNCALGHCMIAMTWVEVPILMEKLEIQKKKSLPFNLAVETVHRFRLAQSSHKTLSLGSFIRVLKIPLYVFYQRLFIP